MKRSFYLSLLSAYFLVLLGGCEKKVSKVYLESSTPPVLTASVSGNIPLSFANQDQEAVKLMWTNPGYQFTTGTSSQNVTYLIEIDTTGANFTNPAKQTISVSRDLALTLTQSQLNDYLLNQLVLKPAISHNIEMRVTASIGSNGAAATTSNVLKFTVTPYAIPPKIAPPASGTLYITGSATPASWMSGGDAERVDQKFTRISDTQYELIITLTGAGSYVFVPKYGDWGSKYAIATKNDPAAVNGGDFMSGGEDILAPASTGRYKIVVDFQRGKFTVTPQ